MPHCFLRGSFYLHSQNISAPLTAFFGCVFGQIGYFGLAPSLVIPREGGPIFLPPYVPSALVRYAALGSIVYIMDGALYHCFRSGKKYLIRRAIPLVKKCGRYCWALVLAFGNLRIQYFFSTMVMVYGTVYPKKEDIIRIKIRID